jgi:hypothetical protein
MRSIEVIRHEDPEHDTHHNRWGTFNNEDPSPGSIPTNTIHKADSIRNETSNGTSDGGSDEQVPDSKSDGSLVVEESQICDEAGEETSFEETEEDTACKELMIALGQAAKRSDEAPDYGDNGDIARGAELLQEEIGGDFEQLSELVNI